MDLLFAGSDLGDDGGVHDPGALAGAIGVERPGNGHPLLLAPGQADTALTDERIDVIGGSDPFKCLLLKVICLKNAYFWLLKATFRGQKQHFKHIGH
jgi:hypothetical protein